MKTPPPLQIGDKIAIVSTARSISEKELSWAIKTINSWGYQVVLGKHLFEKYNQFAGTDEQRANDFQQVIDDETIKAIICARGGYGTVRIINRINFKNFIKKPKWIIGYSDITILHSYIHTLGIPTIHATMPLNFPENGIENESWLSLKNVLSKKTPIEYSFNPHPLNKQGCVDGIVVGGNLSVLYSLRGTNFDIDTSNKILFIEDLEEYLYHIDRMMMNFKLGNKLKNLKALLIGGMNKMNDNAIPYGKTTEEIIYETVSEYNYPVCFNFPAGHIEPNLAFILGSHINIEINTNKCSVIF